MPSVIQSLLLSHRTGCEPITAVAGCLSPVGGTIMFPYVGPSDEQTDGNGAT